MWGRPGLRNQHRRSLLALPAAPALPPRVDRRRTGITSRTGIADARGSPPNRDHQPHGHLPTRGIGTARALPVARAKCARTPLRS